MIRVRKYSNENNTVWDKFIKESKNGLFMFERNYMDYHRDRFTDYSLMFYNDDELVALLPACEYNGTLHSHAGLTFGGFITNKNMKQHLMNACFEALIDYCKGYGFKRMVYKGIPHIYHRQPSEEDRYSLYANRAKLITIDASTYVNLLSPIKMAKGRKAQISRAKRENVEIKILTSWEDYDSFISLENEVLFSRHGVYAVHTSQELKMLHDRFSNNIHLYAALKNEKIIAGVIIYEYDSVVHTQYMAANNEARIIGALDLTVACVIEKYKCSKMWLDFGISTEHGKVYLNEGLIAQKEGFGGRTGVYETWQLDF